MFTTFPRIPSPRSKELIVMYRLLLLNFVDSFIDNCILSCVDEPAYGGIVQCELLLALPHTAVSMWVTAILFILMAMEPLSK